MTHRWFEDLNFAVEVFDEGRRLSTLCCVCDFDLVTIIRTSRAPFGEKHRGRTTTTKFRHSQTRSTG